MEKAQADKAPLQKTGKRQGYESLTDWAREAAQVVTFPIARFLARYHVHPNTLTLIGCLLNVGIAVVLSTGRLTLGGWLLALTAPLDALDGALARVMGQQSRLGAFLDSTLDRVSEAALLSGLAAHFLRQGFGLEVVLAFVALAGSMLVSYTRARAEGLGVSCKGGIFTRMERVAVLTAGLILGLPTATLWVLAIGANLTALQRILYVYQRAQKDGL